MLWDSIVRYKTEGVRWGRKPSLRETSGDTEFLFLFFGAKKFSLWGKAKKYGGRRLLHNTMRRREEVTAMVGMSPRAGATACSERVAAEGRGGARENGCVSV